MVNITTNNKTTTSHSKSVNTKKNHTKYAEENSGLGLEHIIFKVEIKK